MSGAVFAGACSDVVEEPRCYLWDVSFTLKTLDAKNAKCSACSMCGEDEPSYYLDGTTRKIKGYIWSCEYSCDLWNIVLWDEKNKVAVIPLLVGGTNEQTTVTAENALVFSKKANKACASFLITDDAGASIELMACGLNGKVTRKDGDDCYVKNMSGTACGTLAYVKPGVYTKTLSKGTLCSDSWEEIIGNIYDAKCLTWCDACCFNNWCDDGDTAPDMVPCSGTWKMKFNRKLASGKKGSIIDLVPDYAKLYE